MHFAFRFGSKRFISLGILLNIILNSMQLKFQSFKLKMVQRISSKCLNFLYRFNMCQETSPGTSLLVNKRLETKYQEAVRGFDSQRRMAVHTRLNTFFLIALHMSRILHQSFFSQVHMVNTHVFSVGATVFVEFKDIFNTASPHGL